MANIFVQLFYAQQRNLLASFNRRSWTKVSFQVLACFKTDLCPKHNKISFKFIDLITVSNQDISVFINRFFGYFHVTLIQFLTWTVAKTNWLILCLILSKLWFYLIPDFTINGYSNCMYAEIQILGWSIAFGNILFYIQQVMDAR